MARRSDPTIMRLGAISLVVLLIIMAAAFNLQKFPGFKGKDLHVELADASGLHKGNMVQVAGVRVGRVNDLHIHGDHVTVDIDVKDAELGRKFDDNVAGRLDPAGAERVRAAVAVLGTDPHDRGAELAAVLSPLRTPATLRVEEGALA